MTEKPPNPFESFRVEIDPDRIEDTLSAIRDRIRSGMNHTRNTLVRLSFNGKPIGPDIPLAALLATEGVAFWLLSPIAALLVNLGAKSVLDVEFIHTADELIEEGVDAYLDGELALAEAKYREALTRRPNDPAAHYNLGTLLRVSGRIPEAMEHLNAAASGPEDHPDVSRAADAIRRINTPGKTL